MKSFRHLKILIFAISLIIAISSICLLSISGEENSTPKILAQNVAYTGDFSLLYAVSENAVAPVTLYVYNEIPTDESVPIKKYIADKTVSGKTTGLKDSNGTPIDAYIFETDGVIAASMTETFYIKAVGADGKESKLRRYSVAEYLYERLATESITDAQRKLYNKVIEFGDAAQAILEPDEPSIINYRYVKVNNGFIDGFSTGVYPIGTELFPKDESDAADLWTHIKYDEKGNPTSVNFTTSFIVADSFVNIIHLGNVRVYKNGTETFEKYESSGSFEDVVPGLSLGNNATGEFIVDPQLGNGISVNYPSQSSVLYVEKNADIVSDDEADAFEFSFDLKADCNDKSINALQLYFDVGKNAAFDIRITLQNGTSNHELKIYNSYSSTETQTYTGTDSEEYNNIRFVVKYADETKSNVVIYVYVNSSAEPQILSTTAGSISNFASLTRIRVKPEPNSRSGGITLYLDNIYCGLIEE